MTFLRSLPYNMMLGLGWSINAVVPRQREDSLDKKQDESLGLRPLSQPKFGAEDDVIDAISNPTCRDTNQVKSPNFIWYTFRVNQHTGSGGETTMLIVF